MENTKEHQQFDIQIEKVDLTELKDQKSKLIMIQAKFEKQMSQEEWDALEGIINLLDHVQDQARDQHNLEDKYVYNISNEE